MLVYNNKEHQHSLNNCLIYGRMIFNCRKIQNVFIIVIFYFVYLCLNFIVKFQEYCILFGLEIIIQLVLFTNNIACNPYNFMRTIFTFMSLQIHSKVQFYFIFRFHFF